MKKLIQGVEYTPDEYYATCIKKGHNTIWSLHYTKYIFFWSDEQKAKNQNFLDEIAGVTRLHISFFSSIDDQISWKPTT